MLEVILVDDDDIVLMMQRKMISRCEISSSPIVFKSAIKTLEYLNKPENLRNEEKEYLILLDINMPVMSGWQFLDKIKLHPLYNQIHVIMVTSSIDQKDRMKAQSYQRVIDYMEKPITVKHCESLKQLKPITEFF